MRDPATLLNPGQKKKATASTDLNSTETPEVVVVSATLDPAPAYGASEAVSATKTNTRLLDTPQAISVVPRQLIEDQNVIKLEDILHNVAGVQTGLYYRNEDQYRIRGFDVNDDNTFIDGLFGGDLGQEEPWGIERVEVVKGPASTLYGQGPLGGLVNIVSKRPRPENFANVRFTYGSFGEYKPAFDAGWVLNASKTVYARVNALYRSQDTFIDYDHAERIHIAPSLTWEITPATSLTLLTLFRSDHQNFGYPLPARGTVLPNVNGRIPIDRYIGNPDIPNDSDRYTVRLAYEFKHAFNEHLSLRQNFRYFWNRSSADHVSYPSFLADDDRTLALNGLSFSGRNEGLRVDTAMDASFDTGPVKHTLTGGVDYRLTHNRNDIGLATEPVFLDVFAPNYGSLPRYNIVPLVLRKSHDSDLGFYIQEQAKFFDRLTVTLGGRYDVSHYDNTRDNLGEFKTDAFTPKAGLTYEVVKGVALYGNYSRSYFPQFGSFDASGAPVAPEKGENWEAGLKVELLKGKLAGILSAYQLTRQNVATPNLTTPDPDDVIVSGEQRARGIEFEVQSELTRGLQLTAAYAYLDAHITADNVLPVGARLQGAAEHTANAFLKYTILDGACKGLGFGAGGYYTSRAPGDGTYGVGGPKFDLPAYGLLNLAAYYDRGRFSSQINFNNVLDRRYFSGGGGDVYIQPGNPFNVRGTVGWKF